MEVGTAESTAEQDELKVRRERTRLAGGMGPGNGGRGGGDDGGAPGGGGGDGCRFDDQSENYDPSIDKSKFVTWFLLLVVLMTFGGMIGAYVVIATNGAAEWRPFNLPVQTWISTVLILVSSLTYHIGKNALFAGRFELSKRMLLATAGLGGAFIASQLLLWLALVNRGFYMRGNPYAGFFYILTAVHAIHVIGGIIALGVILLRTWNETRFEPELTYRRNLARSVGWYWHFMGALWIVLFVLLGFWK